jgi:hypothetical protein
MNFIYESSVDANFCDTLIAFHQDQRKKGNTFEGHTGSKVDHERKKSLDTLITEDLFPLVGKALQKLTDEYIKKFPWSGRYASWGIREIPQIQYYGPNDGYYAWHTERCNAQPGTQNRHLVYMIYLNDVTDGGGTEFYHQNLIVQPVKGKSLIWPVDWTYTHRGIPSPTQEKYILTGWFEYLDDK